MIVARALATWIPEHSWRKYARNDGAAKSVDSIHIVLKSNDIKEDLRLQSTGATSHT